MYIFGYSQFRSIQEEQLWSQIQKSRREFSQTSVSQIIDVLDGFRNEDFTDLIPEMMKESGLSETEVRSTLKVLPELLKKDNLVRRLNAEFGNVKTLDGFTKQKNSYARVKAIPVGVILHVTAGNVFLSSIDSLVMGLITKNISIVKVSGQNKVFPKAFAERFRDFDENKVLSNKFAIVHWRGGDEKIESFLKKRVNLILAWGGEEMITSYQKDLPHQVKFLGMGPKVSFQVISKKGLENKDFKKVSQKIVQDITPWNQGACSSPQNLFIEEGIDESSLVESIESSFQEAPKRSEISQDEEVEVLKEYYRGLYSEVMEGGVVRKDRDYLIHLESNSFLRPSPLNRSLIIKKYSSLDDLSSKLLPFHYYLQSCSYLLDEEEKESYLDALSYSGIKRFAPLGSITQGMDGAPHDGKMILRELTDLIGDEYRVSDLEDESLSSPKGTLHRDGYIFSTGGTTGEPKFIKYTYDEFEYMSDMLMVNYKKQGLSSGDLVANLFVAGNLWSSFMCVDRALEKIGTIQLPIGGLCAPQNTAFYLQKFPPKAIVGIPSLLISLAEFCKKENLKLSIPLVIYAGEEMSENRKDYLRDIWKVESFGSGGYASVDAGVIGYQCTHAEKGEHHLFEDLVSLKIVEEEIVVSSVARSSSRVLNLRTGDRGVLMDTPCSCGDPAQRFKLLGRIDDVIQIWSCRLLINQIEQALQKFNILSYQIEVSEAREWNFLREKLTIFIEGEISSHDEFIEELYNTSRDVQETLHFSDFRKDIILKEVSEIPRNARTGKISKVRDLRR